VSGFGDRRDAEHTRQASSADLSPITSAADVSEDEFFELAESLSEAPSKPSMQPSPMRPYRGEPMVRKSPSPPVREVGGRLNKGARDDNPFAHEAPTGVRKALVEVSQPSFVLEEIEPEEAALPAEDDTGVIKRLYEQGKIEQAWSRVETVALEAPDSTEIRQLRVKLEQEMERFHINKFGSLDRVPALNVAPSAFASLSLDHRSGFLISQIDGMMTIEDILDLSSMTRLETLMVLSQLFDKQIIKIS
jgi:hypothetical protein